MKEGRAHRMVAKVAEYAYKKYDIQVSSLIFVELTQALFGVREERLEAFLVAGSAQSDVKPLRR